MWATSWDLPISTERKATLLNAKLRRLSATFNGSGRLDPNWKIGIIIDRIRHNHIIKLQKTACRTLAVIVGRMILFNSRELANKRFVSSVGQKKKKINLRWTGAGSGRFSSSHSCYFCRSLRLNWFVIKWNCLDNNRNKLRGQPVEMDYWIRRPGGIKTKWSDKGNRHIVVVGCKIIILIKITVVIVSVKIRFFFCKYYLVLFSFNSLYVKFSPKLRFGVIIKVGWCTYIDI